MVKTIIYIRTKQFYRSLKEVGTYRFLIMCSILAVLAVIIFNLMIKHSNTITATIVIGVVLLGIHLNRKDKHFLKHLTDATYQIYFIEYLILLLPFFIVFAISLNWKGVGLLVICCLIIPLFSINSNILNGKLLVGILLNPFSSLSDSKTYIPLPFINVRAFEWISGIRKGFFIILPVYLVIISLSFLQHIDLIGILLLAIISTGFYLQGEPREYIELFANNSRQFMLRKIFINIKCLGIAVIPIIVMSIIFHREYWYYLVGILILSSLIQIMAVILKYGLFNENIDLNRNGIILTLNIFFILIPFLWPAPLTFGIIYYRKAIKKLNPYFDA